MSERVALVTGGTRGIGYGIASHLADEGFHLALCGLRDVDSVSGIVDSLRDRGINVLYCRADISDAGSREKLLKTIRDRFSHLNLLVNNAGMAPRERKDILEATEASFEEVLRVNLQGPYFLTQATARWMIERTQDSPDFSGCIVNITSVSSTVASPSRGEYCVSKAGLSMATKLWAARLGEHGIPVYEVRPGIVETDMTAGVRQKYDALIEQGLLLQSRWGTPGDIGRIVAALARGDFRYSTGAVIMADGGLTVERL